jgi:phospholipid transport system substrate-binding protein
MSSIKGKAMRRKFFLIAMAWILVFISQGKPCRAGAPTEQVKNMLDLVMSIQTDPQLLGDCFRDKRRVAIKKVIAENFAIDVMAQKSLCNFWNKLDKAQRAEFTNLFKDLFQESYTGLVLDFLGREKILYTKEDPDPGETMVKTIILKTNDEIAVDYFLAPRGQQWLVHDVKIDGVSIVENYQKSFGKVIQQESYKALLQKMRIQQKAIEKPS